MSRSAALPPAPAPEDVAAVAWFLPVLEQARTGGAQATPFGTWQEDLLGRARLEYCPDALALVRLLDELGWVETGQRPGAATVVLRHWQDPALVATADAATLRLLLSDLVRTERICTGHLLTAFERGYLTAILRRLKALSSRPGGDGR